MEDQLRKPVLPPSDQDLITALGEETARVLGQARESALELRAKAEEHARRVVREAQETARELRTTTQQAVEAKTREAEDAARNRAKEIVGEARGLRERVLGDLNQRREELERQIADLRAGRGKLVETYELVERALTHATRVMAEEPSSPPEVPALDTSVPDTPVPDVSAPDAPAPAGDDAPSTPIATKPEPEPEASTATAATAAETSADAQPDAETESETAPDVGALFEKLRSVQTDDEPTGSAPAPEAAAPEPAPVEPASVEPGADLEPADVDGDDGEPERPDAAATSARDAALAEATEDLVRRGKRALQDEQNDILDGLRRQRGKIDVAKVLPVDGGPARPLGPRAAARGRHRLLLRGRVGRRLGRIRAPRPPHRAGDHVGDAAAGPPVQLPGVDRRPHPGRHRDRGGPEPRCPLPRVAGRAARVGAG